MWILTAAAGVLFPQISQAAAQLHAGAKTSAAITATSPAARQIQMTFDPDIVGNATSGNYPLYVQSFQLGLSWDSTYLSYVPGSLTYIDPFYNPSESTPSATTIATLSGIQGAASSDSLVPGDVNLFSAWFQLQPGVPLDQIVSVTFGAQSQDDYITGANPSDPSNSDLYETLYGPGAIQSATASGSVQAGAVPLPAGGWAGLASLAALGFVACRYRLASSPSVQA